ncbi:MAG: MerR family transcriptional regulator [Lachnospiraceae bacterium]|nr:MerR family transcriptional regulator [Lachnospiraceae bacterium]
MGEFYMISDVAKEVQVENHVLRYWEDELELLIHRNESGHRIYTREDVERFCQIKHMKEKGLQLKAINTLLKKGGANIHIIQDREQAEEKEREEGKLEEKVNMGIDIVQVREEGEAVSVSAEGANEDKIRRIQILMRQLVQKSLEDTLPTVLEKSQEQHNKCLRQDIRESMLKELDYQFRMQAEREEERDRIQQERSERYYEQIDELLRRKNSKKKRRFLV